MISAGEVRLRVGPSSHRAMLRSYIAAEGTDKYWVLYSATEIEGSEHEAVVIVATSMDGAPLGDDGQLKLVTSADKKPQRWVRNLTAIRLVKVSDVGLPLVFSLRIIDSARSIIFST